MGEAATPGGETSEHGLKANAIGFTDALVIGLASTAPAYSLAAVIGLVVVAVGVQAPAVLLASFVPMFFIAAAFYYMNRADQDCGTTFSWVTRAMGPWFGWIGGWAICTTGILVVGSLADVAARYGLLLVGWDSAAESKGAVTALAVVIIALMTAVCVLGTELSARLQNVMIFAQVVALLLFAVVALTKGGELDPSLSWLSPFALEDTGVLVSGLLIGVFIYWGWESAVNLTEETEDSETTPGLAAVLSTVILLVTYVLVAVAVVAFAGLDRVGEFEDDDAILSTLAGDVLGSPLDQLIVIAVLTSALASTQTTILPASRTVLSMARGGAMPKSLGAIHPRYLTPHVSTILIGDPRDGLVRAAEPAVGELPVRHAVGAVADDRLLLRAQRLRLRHLLPARADEVGQELPLHRGRAVPGRHHSRVHVRALREGPRRTRSCPTAAAPSSGSACRW